MLCGVRLCVVRVRVVWSEGVRSKGACCVG